MGRCQISHVFSHAMLFLLDNLLNLKLRTTRNYLIHTNFEDATILVFEKKELNVIFNIASLENCKCYLEELVANNSNLDLEPDVLFT